MTFNRILLLSIFAILLLAPIVSAVDVWEYSNAKGQVCFNVSATQTMRGSSSYPFYGVLNISLAHNASFFNGNLLAYHQGSGATLDIFNFANSTTEDYFFLPAKETITGGASDRYCIYVGGTAANDIVDIAPYGMAFDTSLSHLTMVNTTPSTATWSGSYVTLNATGSGRAGFMSASASTTPSELIMFGKFRAINNTGTGGMVSGGNAMTVASYLTYSSGIGLRSGADMRGNWYFNNSYLNPFNDSFNIYSQQVDSATPYHSNATMYTTSMVVLNKTNTIGSNYLAPGVPRYTYFPYVQATEMQFDWAIAGYYPHNEVLAVTDIVYDSVDPNITFTSPSWDFEYDASDLAQITVFYSNNFDQCNLTLNGVVVDTYAPTISTSHSTDIDMATAVNGDNLIMANCSLAGVETHKYLNIRRSGSAGSQLFVQAFGATPGDMGCPAATVLELAKCSEAYNLTTIENFGLVVCSNLNMSEDYSCLETYNINTSINKTGWQFFVRPDTFRYPGNEFADSPFEHIGANFIYGASVDVGVEIISANNTGTGNPMFVFIPAQDRDRDCGIFYQSATAGCSWGRGFTLNNGSVLVSDRDNNWFTSGGVGIEPFQLNISQQVVVTPLFPIIEPVQDVFHEGIWSRLNCYVANNTYEIRAKNTVIQDFSLYVVSNTTIDNLTATSFQYYKSIPLPGVNQIILYGSNGEKLCQYAGGTNLFLPFNLPSIMIPAGFNIIVWAVMLFMTILTSMVPFAVIILILFNDVYHILNISQIATIALLSMLFGFVNNAYNMERGIKHLLIILGVTTAFLAVVSPYATTAGISVSGFDDTITAFNGLRTANDIGSFIFGIPTFIINLFILLLLLPVTFMNFILGMLYYISPDLWTVANSVAPYLTVGIVLYFYLKAYEVLSNKFRAV